MNRKGIEMKIRIMSFEQALNYQPLSNERCSIIRILEPNEKQEKLKYEEYFDDILELFFDDIVGTEYEYLPSNIRLFTKNDAKRVLNFFQKNRNIDSLIIHCFAGISRSPAIALGLSWFLKDHSLEKSIIESGKYIPNQRVMRILAEMLGVYEEKKEFIENYTPEINNEDNIW